MSSRDLRDVAGALRALFPGNDRAATFADALDDGHGVTLATSLARKVPAGEGASSTVNQSTGGREARLAELQATAAGYGRSRGYRQ